MNAGIELRHLRYFLAVESELSFTRAAARLGLAQPNLSEQIRQLEVRVGTLLFQRTKRRVELTAAGRAFGAEALRTLVQADRAVEAARLAAAGRSGVVRVGFVESAGIRFLPPLLGTFAHTHPSVEVSLHQLSTAQQVAGLERRELDVGFMTQVLSTAFRWQPVARERINVVLPTGHELAERDVVPLRMLDGETLLFRTREVAPAAFDAVMSAFREAGVVPRLVLHPVGASMLQGLVAHGAGLTLASEAHNTRRDLAVVYRPLVEPELHSDLYAVWTGDEPEPATAEFLAVATAARADS